MLLFLLLGIIILLGILWVVVYFLIKLIEYKYGTNLKVSRKGGYWKYAFDCMEVDFYGGTPTDSSDEEPIKRLAKKTEKPKTRHAGKCDGDCANCPPHYGDRHGRWYYGHNHIEGCVFGGNKGSGGRD